MNVKIIKSRLYIIYTVYQIHVHINLNQHSNKTLHSTHYMISKIASELFWVYESKAIFGILAVVSMQYMNKMDFIN